MLLETSGEIYETLKTPPVTTIKTSKLSNIARYEPSEREQNSPMENNLKNEAQNERNLGRWDPGSHHVPGIPGKGTLTLTSTWLPCIMSLSPDPGSQPCCPQKWATADAEGSGAGGVQTAKASRKQSCLSGKESAQACPQSFPASESFPMSQLFA